MLVAAEWRLRKVPDRRHNHLQDAPRFASLDAAYARDSRVDRVVPAVKLPAERVRRS